MGDAVFVLLSSCVRSFFSRAGYGSPERIVTEMNAPVPGEPTYSAIRFGYARNNQAVTYVLGETWDGTATNPANYTLTFAREFRYDGPRERYMTRALDPASLMLSPPQYLEVPGQTVGTDYDGDRPYGDFMVAGNVDTTIKAFELGLGRVDNLDDAVNAVTSYSFANHLGTTKEVVTDAWPTPGGETVMSAFGEPVSGPGVNGAPGSPNRFGYAGAWGYQTATSESPGDPYVDSFPFLHVGARYYDPANGRFLQRDPIGIKGGMNVYAYGINLPTVFVDPRGLISKPSDVGGPTVGDALTGLGVTAVAGGSAAVGVVSGVTAATTTGLVGTGGIVGGTLLWGRTAVGDLITFCAFFPIRAYDAVVNDPKPPPQKPSRIPNVNVPCFVAGTLVQTGDGVIPIEQIRIGAEVWTKRFDTDELFVAHVLASGRSGTVTRLVEILVENEVFRSTLDHPYWTRNRGWVEAEHLTVKDVLETRNQQPIPVIGIRIIELKTPVPVYDIRVHEYHWFYIGRCGILVHNTQSVFKKGCRSLSWRAEG